MRRVAAAAALAIAVLALPARVRAEPPADGEKVPLYTNADLEKFGPPTAPAGPVRVPDAGEWRVVQEFLDREYARVDADRRHDLDRAVVDAYTAPPEPHYHLLTPYYGYYGSYGYAGYWGFHGYPGYPRSYPYGVPVQDRRLRHDGHGGAWERRDGMDRAGSRGPTRAAPMRGSPRGGDRSAGGPGR